MKDRTTSGTADACVRTDIPESTYHLFNINFERGPATEEEYAKFSSENRYSMQVNSDMYPLPDLFSDKGAPKGTVTAGVLENSRFYPGTEHRYWLYVPVAYDPGTPACFALVYDGRAHARKEYPDACSMFDNLIASGDIPPTVVLFLDFGVPGPGQPVLGFNEGQVNRSLEYDTPSDLNSRFVAEEVLPKVLEGLNVSDDPADRMVMGLSSSGLAAFSTAWFRPDQFGKVYMASASFVNIRTGIIWPSVIRMSEKKDIAVFAVVGRHDLDNLFGNWFYANLDVGSALHFRGYDSEMYISEAGHSFAAYMYMMPRAVARLLGGGHMGADNMETADFSGQVRMDGLC